METDPPGTCHLVGCAGKGVHKVTEPHSLPSDPPRMTEIAVAYPELRKPIGTPDSWAPYEGGPTIPKPEPDYCLGFPKLWSGDGKMFACCSIRPAGWVCEWRDGEVVEAPMLVDRHKAYCTNRAKR